MDGLVKTLGTVLLLLAAAIWAAVLLLAVSVRMRLAGMKTYEVVLKGCGRGLPCWLIYRVTAESAEEAVCKAKKQTAEHYIEFEWFEVQAIGEVHT